jgi:hypothetical protein
LSKLRAADCGSRKPLKRSGLDEGGAPWALVVH